MIMIQNQALFCYYMVIQFCLFFAWIGPPSQGWAPMLVTMKYCCCTMLHGVQCCVCCLLHTSSCSCWRKSGTSLWRRRAVGQYWYMDKSNLYFSYHLSLGRLIIIQLLSNIHTAELVFLPTCIGTIRSS